MTFLELQRRIKSIKKQKADINPAILRIYNKALKEANKVIKEELGDTDTVLIRFTGDTYD